MMDYYPDYTASSSKKQQNEDLLTLWLNQSVYISHWDMYTWTIYICMCLCAHVFIYSKIHK